MLMTCIGGPLHGLQVGLADDARVYELQDSKPRARYLRQVKSQQHDPQCGNAGSSAFFALSSLSGREVTDLVIAHLEAFRLLAPAPKPA
jgi:hypothetical protein